MKKNTILIGLTISITILALGSSLLTTLVCDAREFIATGYRHVEKANKVIHAPDVPRTGIDILKLR